MNYKNSTVFPSLAYEAIDPTGHPFHVAVLRMTFDIHAQGRLAYAVNQDPLILKDEFFGETNPSCVKHESDLAPYKPWCDVIIHGYAQAPGKKPSKRFDAVVRITRGGEVLVNKQVTVTGPRYWEKRFARGWRLTEPEPIYSLPLTYEYAYGGECRIEKDDPAARRISRKFKLTPEERSRHPDGPEHAPTAHSCAESNPIGRGFADSWYLKARKQNRISAPQIESPLDPIKKFAKTYLPQGFGVIGRAWASRSALCGTINEAFVKSDKWLPEDFDFAYWNGAHPDLQVPWLQGDETIDLTNLGGNDLAADRMDSLGNRVLRLILPGHQIIAEGRRTDGEMLRRNFCIDTVTIDLRARKLNLVYRLQIPKIPQVEMIQAKLGESHG